MHGKRFFRVLGGHLSVSTRSTQGPEQLLSCLITLPPHPQAVIVLYVVEDPGQSTVLLTSLGTSDCYPSTVLTIVSDVLARDMPSSLMRLLPWQRMNVSHGILQGCGEDLLMSINQHPQSLTR